jgi:hypothetical protein
MIRSGLQPVSENGISYSFTMRPQTPFCPCLLENLSPSSGRLIYLKIVLITFGDCSFAVTITLSI